MRDLYLNLNLDGPVDDPKLLGEAIGRCGDAKTVRAARHILLNPNRKQHYDCNHRVLSTIGELRARLELPQTQQWDALGNQDFEFEILSSSTWTDPLDRLDDDDLFGDAAIKQPVRQLPRTKHLAPAVPLRIVFGGVVILACFYLLVVSSLLRPKTVSLPEHGTVVRNDRYSSSVTSRSSRITFEAPNGKGHYHIRLISAEHGWTVLTVVVREGQSTTVQVAPGDYQLRFSVGEERHWDGGRFDPPIRQIEPLDISVPPDGRIRLR